MPRENITDTWLQRKARPTGVQTDYWDTNEPGFGLRISKNGKMTWVLFYRPKGEKDKKRLSIGTYPAMPLSDARSKARQWKLDIERGADPAQERDEANKAPTFKKLAEQYIELYAKPNKRTWERDLELLERNVLDHWGYRKAHDIKRKDVIAVLDSVATRAPIAANRTLAVIRKLFNWAVSRDLVEYNPCLQVKAPGKERQRDRVLNDDEIKAFWHACDALTEKKERLVSPQMAAIFRFRLVTAQRGAEVESMAWEDVDLKSGWWTIPAERAKNGLSHRVPLSPLALELLDEQKARAGDSPWVFPSPSRKGRHVANIHKAAELVVMKTGLTFVMHDLRRTAASHMASMGVSRLVISKLLNHVEQGVTRVYDRHSYDPEKRKALDAWSARLLELVRS